MLSSILLGTLLETLTSDRSVPTWKRHVFVDTLYSILGNQSDQNLKGRKARIADLQRVEMLRIRSNVRFGEAASRRR